MKTRILLLCSAATWLSGCSFIPGPYLDASRLDQTAQPVVEQATYPVRPIDVTWFKDQSAQIVPSVCPLTCFTKDTRKAYRYKIGIDDQLTIIVWNHPELASAGGMGGGVMPPLPPQGNSGTGAGGTSFGQGGGTTGGASSGGGSGETAGNGGFQVRVAPDGTIFFPRIGRMKVVDMTTQEVREAVKEGLQKTIREPQVDVRVSGFNSKSIQMTGQVHVPQAEAITDTPLTILDAFNRAGGSLDDADLQNIGVMRGGTRYTVDVASILETGDQNQNVVLQDGDIVDVPNRANSRVFVLGEISKPTSLPMNRGRLTLADAITDAGSIDPKTSDPRLIYVIRGADKSYKPEIFRLDMTQVDSVLLMTKFELKPRDVVYVQVSNTARFNRVLDQITPTLQLLFFTKALVDN
ncbi:polysaccharide biosynthesis/export family protein [Paraburkholderia sp. J67]|uniref:polysaccharide biosynthesis/export family protein n=1 Tax=Paraburkholderia sp. J67 TaxID=2805435 RepID=UPI002ABDF3CF|nr:polysaccharide biosynthesis/export family protein [Paraburkholderia sp. J67]